MSKILFCDRCGGQIAVDPTDKAIPYNSGHCTRMFMLSITTSDSIIQ